MFSETPAASLTEANFNAALKFIMLKVGPSAKCSKTMHKIFQSAACGFAGLEIQQGKGFSDSGLMTGIRCHKETKWSDHLDAFNRHVDLLFSDHLSPFKSELPIWLTPGFIRQRTLKGAQYDRTKDALWVSFETLSRVIKCVYLPKYNKVVPPTKKLPSGEAWLEAFERFRKALWFSENPSGSSNNIDDGDDANTQPAEPDVEHVEPEDDNHDNDNAGGETNDLSALDALIVPEGYIPKYLLAFLLLGPCSLEPNAAWNITSLEVARSNKVVQLPSSAPRERPSSSATDPSPSPSPSSSVTPEAKPCSRANIADIKKELNSKKRTRDATSAQEVAALERSNTIMEQKNEILKKRDAHKAILATIQIKKEGLRWAEDLEMDQAVIKQLKLELFELCKACNVVV